MQPGIHAFTWTMKWLGVALAVLTGLVLLSYFVVVAVVVLGQAAAGFGH